MFNRLGPVLLLVRFIARYLQLRSELELIIQVRFEPAVFVLPVCVPQRQCRDKFVKADTRGALLVGGILPCI